MIDRSNAALLDLAGHILYLRQEAGPQAAERFRVAVRAALQRLEKFPYLGRPRHFRQPGLRSWGVPGFRNWLLFYLPIPGGIQLYRVLHGSMDLPAQLGASED